MFLQYASLGLWNVTISAYVTNNTGSAGRGLFDSDFIGDVLTVQSLGAMVAPVLLGVVADRHFATQRVLAVLHALTAVLVFAMAEADRQWVFFAATFAYFQCFAPTGALTSSLALRHFDGRPQGFPFVRAMGTAGWVAAGLLVGVLWRWASGDSIEGTAIPMRLAAACHLIMAVYSLTLPHTPPLSGEKAGWRVLIGGAELWRNRSFVALVALSALVMAPAQFYNGFIHTFLYRLGVEDPASKLALGQAVEVAVMIALPSLMLRFRLTHLFAIGAAAWAGRFALLWACSVGAPSWLTYPAILVHGFAFVFVYMTGQIYIDRIAPRNARAAAQGIHTVAVFGVGNLLGAVATGAAQARLLTPTGVDPPPYDWTSFWMLACICSVVASAAFVFVFREPTDHASGHQPGKPPAG